jgi:hypothetical protein
VFPLRVGEKAPATSSGFKDATTDLHQIEKWWTRTPTANIGVRTGRLVVIDVDTKDGVDGWENWFALVDEHATGYPDTFEVGTPSGGGHFYFTSTVEIRNSAKKLTAGVDVRGVGGYVVAPPSRLSDVGVYELERRLPVAPLPEWLCRLLTAKPPASTSKVALTSPPAVGGRRTGYGAAALVDEVAKVRSAVVGTRNHTLNAAAFSLGQLVAGGVLDGVTVVRELVAAAGAVGLGEQEAVRTIESAFTAAAQTPRSPR